MEDGQIRLPPDVRLPDHTIVYILIPDARTPPRPHIATPRLLHPERATELQMEVIENSRCHPMMADGVDPPAPLVIVTLRNAAERHDRAGRAPTHELGAMVTLLPRAAAEHIGATPDPNRFFELEEFDGTVTRSPIVRLEFDFCRRKFRGEYLLVDQEWGILGRNVLNNVPCFWTGRALCGRSTERGKAGRHTA